ncbi:aldo/keto reductase [Kribbella sp. NPDC004875]|uniref:aldo/keto reductase n=1 Tax=Kribbella sp. NPDC004875 TaxID=3364107 RepID=UPI0036CF5DC9
MTNLALGAMEYGSRIDEQTSFRLLDAYVDAGGEWIDTANCYAFWQHPSGHGGQSEELLGRWLAQRPGVRDRVKLATKVGCEPLWPGSYPEHAEGLSAKAIDAALETSLRRLCVDHIDLYWAHRDDRATPLEETATTFGKHAAAGTIGRIGLSNYALWRVERFHGVAAGLGVMGRPRCNCGTRTYSRGPSSATTPTTTASAGSPTRSSTTPRPIPSSSSSPTAH